MNKKEYPIKKSEEEWMKELGPERYYILREKGTERPFTGAYNLTKEGGNYSCGACKTKLFESSSKFESGCGWPSFDDAIEGMVNTVEDRSHGMIRTEIVCASCGSHLGHVFNDGPTKTGVRYCVNSLSVDFKKL